MSWDHWIIYHLANGQAFFSGTGLLVAGILSSFVDKSWVQRSRTWLIVLGLILVILSTTPIPLAGYGILFAITGCWIASERLRKASPAVRNVVRLAAALAWIAAAAGELSYHRLPAVANSEGLPLEVIGDSLTAGINDERTNNWPMLLATAHGIEVRDHAQAGATASSAQSQAKEFGEQKSLVLVGIGGNDLLAGVSAEEFSGRLDSLLREICKPGRTVLMFELPLPPMKHGFGLAQRQLARKYGVGLIPKRILMGVLLSSSTTLDSIHLSPAGHKEMAAAIWPIIANDPQPRTNN